LDHVCCWLRVRRQVHWLAVEQTRPSARVMVDDGIQNLQISARVGPVRALSPTGKLWNAIQKQICKLIG
jgi:hypothetical protein